MEIRRNTRSLKQTRSYNTKQKIIDTAYKIFCEKGYYKTTSIEISKEANISIGCFYSYFKDKDAVFYEILDVYNKEFIKVLDKLSLYSTMFTKDRQKYILNLINKLVEIHKSSKDFNKELLIISKSNQKVCSILDRHHEKIVDIIKNYLLADKNEINVEDIDAAAIIIYDLVNSIVDRVVFEESAISSERILNSGVEAIHKYLYK